MCKETMKIERSAPDRMVYRQAKLDRVRGIGKMRVIALFLLLPIFRDCDRPDGGVPVYTEGRCAACLLR